MSARLKRLDRGQVGADALAVLAELVALDALGLVEDLPAAGHVAFLAVAGRLVEVGEQVGELVLGLLAACGPSTSGSGGSFGKVWPNQRAHSFNSASALPWSAPKLRPFQCRSNSTACQRSLGVVIFAAACSSDPIRCRRRRSSA